MSAIELVVLDMAGTTVQDDGLVERAFQLASERTGAAARLSPEDALAYVRQTMGMSKIDVFTHLAGGDAAVAAAGVAAFESAYAELVTAEGVCEVPGAGDTIGALQDAGLRVALTTGFAPVTRNILLDALGWRELVDLALSPVDAGRGRPAPDLVLAALLKTETTSVEAVAVVGDTTSDIGAGRRAGAGFVAGVLSGTHGREELAEAGADAILSDVTALPQTLRTRGLWPGAESASALAFEEDLVAASGRGR